MSGSGAPIDLNSDVALGDREIESRGFNISEPVTHPFNGQIKAETLMKEHGEEGVENASERLCTSNKDEADANMIYEAAGDEYSKGISLDNVKGSEMKLDLMDNGVRAIEESSTTISDLSEAQRECSERIHVSEERPIQCADEILADENDVASESGYVNGLLSASSIDDTLSCESKRQISQSLVSLKESPEHGRTSTIASESIVESQEGACTMQNEYKKVAQDKELAFHSDNPTCDDRSHRLLGHGNSIKVPVHLNPEGPCQHNDVGVSGNLDSPGNPKDTELCQNSENLAEYNKLSPPAAIHMKTMPIFDCPVNQTKPTSSRQIDVDEECLFDVVVSEMEPHIIKDEEDGHGFIDVNSNLAVSVVGFNISDLVWGKVRSHPWWPGQICDPSASSKKAMKYFKEDRFLVAFFGDHTFSWKEASMIKPFQEYFLELQNQSNLKSFHQAIDCALDEFSRRVEFSLACSCLSEESYTKLQSQTITNAGIRKKFSRRIGGDSFLTAFSFNPTKVINIVKEVASMPCDEADRLELIKAQAQLSAFNRWKGCPELPEFNMHKVVLNDTDELLVVENDNQSELIKDVDIDMKGDEVAPYGKGNLKTQDSCGSKRKHYSGIHSNKKGKKLPEKSKKAHSYLHDKRGSDENVDSKLIFHAPVDAVCDNPAVNETVQTNQSFRVGDRIRRVACKLHESNPVFKHDDEISQKTVATIKRKPTKMPDREPVLIEYPVNEVLSQLYLAALNPMEGDDFMNLVKFHSKFRNFVCLDPTNLREQDTLEQVFGGKTGNELTGTEKLKETSVTEVSDSEFIKDSYWTDRLIRGIGEDDSSLEKQNETVDCQIKIPGETVVPAVEVEEGLLCTGMDSTNQGTHECVGLESETSMEDPYPTALILNFTDLDSVPSETNLNDIFGKYGALYESKTEVLKKSRRAKVVFKRSCDAEVAFSSAGKYSIFGPSLVSYRLKYLPLPPAKVSSRPAKRRRKEAKTQENAT